MSRLPAPVTTRLAYPPIAAVSRAHAMTVRCPDAQAPDPVPAPEAPLLLGELLAAVPVPERLVKEPDERRPHVVEDDRVGHVPDRGALPDRSQVQVDVLCGDEPRVEASELLEQLPPVREVARGIGHVVTALEQLDPLQVPVGRFADRDRPPGHDRSGGEASPQGAEPPRVGETVSVNERDELAPRLAHAAISSDPSGPGVGEDANEPRTAGGVALGDLERPVPAPGIDEDDLERPLLTEEAVQQLGEVAFLVADGDDDRDQAAGSVVTSQCPSRRRP